MNQWMLTLIWINNSHQNNTLQGFVCCCCFWFCVFGLFWFFFCMLNHGFSNFRIHQNKLENLLKHWLLGSPLTPTPLPSQQFLTVSLPSGQRICISTSFQLMLILTQEPRFKNHLIILYIIQSDWNTFNLLRFSHSLFLPRTLAKVVCKVWLKSCSTWKIDT